MNYKAIITVAVGLLAFLFVLFYADDFFDSTYEKDKKLCRDFYRKEIRGTVQQKFKDHGNKLYFTIILKTGEEYWKFVPKQAEESKRVISLGDSIIKKAFEGNFLIQKDTGTIQIKDNLWGCEHYVNMYKHWE